MVYIQLCSFCLYTCCVRHVASQLASYSYIVLCMYVCTLLNSYGQLMEVKQSINQLQLGKVNMNMHNLSQKQTIQDHSLLRQSCHGLDQPDHLFFLHWDNFSPTKQIVALDYAAAACIKNNKGLLRLFLQIHPKVQEQHSFSYYLI